MTYNPIHKYNSRSKLAERYAAATLRNRGAINAALAAETSDETDTQ